MRGSLAGPVECYAPSVNPLVPLIADLAPGDRRCASYDWRGLDLRRVSSATDPWFDAAYECLWREFGPRGEMEPRRVIEDRLAWHPVQWRGDVALTYEMLVVSRGDSLVAVRDHSVILGRDGFGVVHLSHVCIAPERRGSGLAGWLRCLPIQTARACAAAAGIEAPLRLVLVAEMEPLDDDDATRLARLRSYGRAGFRLLDGRYAQPDFRPPAQIDATGFQPLPLWLMVRCFGDEAADSIEGQAAATIVGALYTMFGEHLRPVDVRRLREEYEPPLRRRDRIALRTFG